MEMARWVLPVPMPPTNTTLRCWAGKSTFACPRTNASLIGCLIDRGTGKLELGHILGQRQLGDGHLVFD